MSLRLCLLAFELAVVSARLSELVSKEPAAQVVFVLASALWVEALLVLVAVRVPFGLE